MSLRSGHLPWAGKGLSRGRPELRSLWEAGTWAAVQARSPAAGPQELGVRLRVGSGGPASGHLQAAERRLDFGRVAVPDPTLRTRARLTSVVTSPEVRAWNAFAAPARRQGWGGGTRDDGPPQGRPCLRLWLLHRAPFPRPAAGAGEMLGSLASLMQILFHYPSACSHHLCIYVV